MSNLAGVRRSRALPVTLVTCPFAGELMPGSWVIVADLQTSSGEAEYPAEVVFGPHQVMTGGAECRPAGAIVRLAAASERPAGHAVDSATAEQVDEPGWIGLAPSVLLPANATPTLPRTIAGVAAAGAALLAAVESGGFGVRGFHDDLPALGATIALAGGGTAVVTGIDGLRGLLHARLPTGEELVGPLPAPALPDAWAGFSRPAADGNSSQEGPARRRRHGASRDGQGGR